MHSRSLRKGHLGKHNPPPSPPPPAFFPYPNFIAEYGVTWNGIFPWEVWISCASWVLSPSLACSLWGRGVTVSKTPWYTVQALFSIIKILVCINTVLGRRLKLLKLLTETNGNSRTGFLWPVRKLCFHLLLRQKAFVCMYNIYSWKKSVLFELSPFTANVSALLGNKRTSLQATNE